MEIVGSNIVGNVVADNYKAASVFKAYGIDFCCKGNRSISASLPPEFYGLGVKHR